MEMPSKQRDFVRQAFEIPDAPLDAVDRRIVAELQAAPRLRIAELSRRIGPSRPAGGGSCVPDRRAPPRLRIAELSRRIGLSGPAVADRLRRLEESGTLS